MNLAEIISQLIALLRTHQTILKWLSLGSLITFCATPLLVILIIIKLPPDYFLSPEKRVSKVFRHYSVGRLLFKIFKNFLGVLILITGFILLFMPGQGMLTILIGLMLINFPGKYRLERRILSRPKVLQSLNKLRQRFNQPPLVL